MISDLNKKRFALVFGPCIIFLLLFILIFVNKSPATTQVIDNQMDRDVPVLKQKTAEFALSAESHISVYVSKDGKEKVLTGKEKDLERPIASVTKLMTALIATSEYEADDIVTISKDSLLIKGISGIYHAGDKFLFSDALSAMLIASHNELAEAIAEKTGVEKFVNLMNKKASKIDLLNTKFVNPIGTDPGTERGEINHSTPFDLYKLARYIKENNPEILSITTTKEFKLLNSDGKFVADIKNTDKLLGQKDLPFNIIGGKTGETPLAKKNLVIATDAPCGGNIYSVVLGSDDNFDDMKKLLEYVTNSYSWTCEI